MNAFKNLVSKAIEDRVSFVLISGDIFDKPAVSLKVEHNFFSCIRDLSDNNIGIFIIFGNHDSEYFQAKRDFLKEIPGLNFFPLDSSIGSFEVNDKRIVIYGMNYSANSEISSLSRLHDKNSFKIAMYHGDILAIPSEDSFLYGLLRKNDLLKTNIDYWALGHLHQFNVINKTPYIIYPGTPQGRSFKPAECGDKGCVKVTISDNISSPVNHSWTITVVNVGELYNNITNLQNQINALQLNISILLTQLNEALENNTELQGIIANLTENLTLANNQISLFWGLWNLSKMNETELQACIDNLTENLTTANEQISILWDLLNMSKLNETELQNLLNISRQNETNLFNQINELENENTKLRNELNETKKTPWIGGIATIIILVGLCVIMIMVRKRKAKK